MKLVTFNRAMAPYGAGETKLVSDEIAASLEAEGSVSSAVDWPAAQAEPESSRPGMKPRLSVPARRPQSYLTK